MNNDRRTSIKFYGFFIQCLLAVVFSCAPVSAQDGGQSGFPLLFDGRERLARPDLSAVPRLRFLTTVDFPPFNFIDQSGKLSGFHVDLVREICKELHAEAKCQIQAIPFADLRTALTGGKGEAVAAGLTVTGDLRREFEFSRTFLQLPARFAVNRKASGTAATAVDLDAKPVGIVGGTAHEAMLKAFFPKITPVVFQNRGDMLAALKKGEIHAVFSDGLQLSFWIAGTDSAGCCSLFDGPYISQRFLGEGMSIMVKKDDADIARAIDSALLALSRNGRLNEIYLRYFPNSIY
ncbi:transporter substrate-binding domain-containing protein [Pararhizobium sp.]|uniref:transporter substrate-binding domain-containing protein n=1 Tax=Pararhizobium sp. TaxID=1977563 RepID=UPI0027196C47|nr:transporter substrate-binding domain-containing protein [Pararhizobium sp.]MDO9416321.1 transporter substrate-binding domain-containing protein [Pararhizobium sp.]